MNPEQRTASLLHFFGWQGGTIHQIAKETGVDSHTLLYGEPENKNSMSCHNGWFSHRTCSREHRVHMSKEYHGDIDYWLSVERAGIIPFDDD